VLPWVDVATGSLGQGLPDAVGVCHHALADQLRGGVLRHVVAQPAGQHLSQAPTASRILNGPELDQPAAFELGHVLESDGYLFLRYHRRL
jgi:hypothetical protein